jgi:chromosome condensin MukBEF complex kleisin-like MukF subunit
MESEGNYFHTFYFQAFSDQFALVSEEVSELAEQGESILSDGNADADGALSAKLQDVRRRFLRIQELVEKQNELERFENAVQEYRSKLDAVKSRASSGVQNVEVILCVCVIL